MTFEWLAFGSSPHFDISLNPPGILVGIAYLAACLALGARGRRHLAAFGPAEWALFSGLLLAGAICARLMVVRFDGPGLSGDASLPLLGLLPAAAAALWLGAEPALLVGLVSGLAGALFEGGRATQPFETAITGALIGLLLQQTYRGRLANLMRSPAAAAGLGSLVAAWPLKLLGVAVTDHLPFFASLDHLITLFLPTLATCLASGLIAGLALQALVGVWPGLRKAPPGPLSSAPWERHLGQRMVFALAPLAALAVIGLVGVVAITSYLVATNLVVEQMGRSAAHAGSGIPFFIQEGRSLIRNLAENGQVNTADAAARQEQLAASLRTVPFFQQLVYVDPQGHVANSYPTGASLSGEEENRVRLALQGSVPTEVVVTGPSGATISFVAAVGRKNGALVGRTSLANNPALAPVAGVLQGGVGAGHGMLVDSQNRVLLDPASAGQGGQPFTPGAATDIAGALPPGQAYRAVNGDGTRSLIYVLPVAGQSDWSVVLIEPNEVALRLAIQIAVPTLGLLVVILSIISGVGVLVVRSITRPLEALLSAVQGIGEGDLERAVTISGEDEIGQLGTAFEQMRGHLKARLEEQERLLRVSRSVSASLELFRAMPPILSSALDVTHAAGVRIALRHGSSSPLQVYSAGEAAAAMAGLDSQLTDLVERQGTVVISQVRRASGSLNVDALPPATQALVALPLRSENSFHGILWLTYDHEHVIEQSELTFLGTLAGQAAVAIANARLLAEAQEGRQNLEAILESTADGMVVVDNQGKIALLNPAAERQFNIRQEHARGHAAGDVIHFPNLAALLTDFKEPVATIELPGSNGKTLLVNTSTIVGHDGAISGRVALLRDITPIRELDNIKTVFLRMVSHDLRSPLTYMRGYLSLIPLTGELNDPQQDALGKVNMGIQHISEMTERLLYLSRLKFGDEAELELALIDVEEMLNDVQTQLKGAAADRSITVILEIGDKLPLLLVDGLLYQQAISNLVGNAIKYTQEGGQVTVRAFVDEGDWLTVSVTDNGPGIRPEDQERLFEAFYRVPQREGGPPRPPGTGLGLALVKAIAETHNGSVGVETAFGQGSTFRLTMPIRNPGDF